MPWHQFGATKLAVAMLTRAKLNIPIVGDYHPIAITKTELAEKRRSYIALCWCTWQLWEVDRERVDAVYNVFITVFIFFGVISFIPCDEQISVWSPKI